MSKAIDKAAGVEREVIGQSRTVTPRDGRTGSMGSPGDAFRWGSEWLPWDELPAQAVAYYMDRANARGQITAPATPEAEQWQGWGTALKPAHEPIVVARKPLAGTVAANVLEHGTGALNVDGCRVEHDGSGVWGDHGQNPERHDAVPGGNGHTFDGGPTRSGVSQRHAAGRWPANVVLSHTEDCQQVGTRKVKGNPPPRFKDTASLYEHAHGDRCEPLDYATETVAAWSCSPDCPVRLLDEQTGDAGGGFGIRGKGALGLINDDGWEPSQEGQRVGYGDSGGASRFFYVAKASSAERGAGLSARDGKICVCPDPKDREASPPRDTSEPIEEDGYDSSTAGNGSSTTDPSPQASRSTTSTGSRPTTESRTSPSLTPPPTSGFTPPTSESEAGTSGSDGALSAVSGSPPTQSTTTSAEKAGSSTADADLATSQESSQPSSSAGKTCPDCGGVIGGGRRNVHPLANREAH